VESRPICLHLLTSTHHDHALILGPLHRASQRVNAQRAAYGAAQKSLLSYPCYKGELAFPTQGLHHTAAMLLLH